LWFSDLLACNDRPLVSCGIRVQVYRDRLGCNSKSFDIRHEGQEIIIGQSLFKLGVPDVESWHG
jgi:hypothetical protein